MKKITVAGIILTISISPLFRGLFFNLEASAVFTLISILSAVYFFIKLSNKEDIFFNKLLLIPGSLLLVAYALSFINAASIRDNIDALIQYAEYFIVSVIFYDYFHDKEKKFISAVALLVIAVGFISAIIGLEAMTGAFSILNDTLFKGRIGSTFQYANMAAVYFAICLLFSLMIINSTSKMNIRIMLTGVGNILAFALVLTGSRGGYIVAATGILLFLVLQPSGYKLKAAGYFLCMGLPLVYFLNRFNTTIGSNEYLPATKWLALSMISTLIICLLYEWISKFLFGIKNKTVFKLVVFSLITAFTAALVILIIVYKEKITGILPQIITKRMTSLEFMNGSVVPRLEFIQDAIKLIEHNWVFGLGGGGWAALYQSVQEHGYTARAVHNNYLQVFVEAGVLAFLSYISLILASLFNAVYSLLKTRDTKQKIYVVGFLCGYLMLVVHSAMDFDLTFVSIALLFWVFVTGFAICIPDTDENIKSYKYKLIIFTNRSMVSFAFIILCSALFSINALYTTAAYNGNKGLNYLEAGSYQAAQAYYEEANRLDPINPEYTFQLTKLYNYFAQNSTNPESIKDWRDKARVEAEKSVKLNKYYPAYLSILFDIYIDSDMPIQALNSAEELIRYQPCDSKNYELLAEGYLGAADYYKKARNNEKSKELLILCSKINNYTYARNNKKVELLRNKAISLLDLYKD